MKAIKTLATIAALAITSACSSFAGIYTGASLLWDFNKGGGKYKWEKYNNGFGGMIRLGYAIDEHHGFHLESGWLTYGRSCSDVNYITSQIPSSELAPWGITSSQLAQGLKTLGVKVKAKGTQDVIPVLANYQSTYEFENQFFLQGSAGAGLAWVRAKNSLELKGGIFSLSGSDKVNTTTFAWQARLGAGYRFNENIELAGGYRMLYLWKKNFKKDGIHIGGASHMAELALNVRF